MVAPCLNSLAYLYKAEGQMPDTIQQLDEIVKGEGLARDESLVYMVYRARVPAPGSVAVSCF
jgi:hypothetical protein